MPGRFSGEVRVLPLLSLLATLVAAQPSQQERSTFCPTSCSCGIPSFRETDGRWHECSAHELAEAPSPRRARPPKDKPGGLPVSAHVRAEIYHEHLSTIFTLEKVCHSRCAVSCPGMISARRKWCQLYRLLMKALEALRYDLELQRHMSSASSGKDRRRDSGTETGSGAPRNSAGRQRN